VPVAGRDYPGSYAELLSWFPDDAACLDYLEWLRWPDGIRCPRCAGRDGWRLGSGLWECAVCGRQASATAGTIFHRTRTPLRLWFAAAWQMTSQKHGVSALGVQRSLGLGSYQTAWAMLHRYRVAMVRPGRERLSGHVEVDETYLGGVESKVYGRETETKAIVAIAVEIENPKGFGRIRLGHIADVSADSLLPFIDAAVEPGATVHTDGWQAYWTLPDRGYEHERTVVRKQSDPHQGSVSVEHLQAYLNEYTFRFDRRRSRRRGLLFYRLLEQAVIAEPITYRGLIVNSKPTGRRPSLPSRPGRVATVEAVHRPWRQTPAATGPPDSNG
jgi:transposase-like protein